MNPRSPYHVCANVAKRRWFIFPEREYVIMYDDCPVFSTPYETVAEDTCKAMNVAYQVGHYDAVVRGKPDFTSAG